MALSRATQGRDRSTTTSEGMARRAHAFVLGFQGHHGAAGHRAAQPGARRAAASTRW